MIVGAGSMGALAGATLQRMHGGGDVDAVVLNRSPERAERLAGSSAAGPATWPTWPARSRAPTC